MVLDRIEKNQFPWCVDRILTVAQANMKLACERTTDDDYLLQFDTTDHTIFLSDR